MNKIGDVFFLYKKNTPRDRPEYARFKHSARMPRNPDQWYFLVYTRYYEIPKRFPMPQKTFLVVLAMENIRFEGGSTDFTCQKDSKLVKYPTSGRF